MLIHIHKYEKTKQNKKLLFSSGECFLYKCSKSVILISKSEVTDTNVLFIHELKSCFNICCSCRSLQYRNVAFTSVQSCTK
jgi:hypothetical protein